MKVCSLISHLPDRIITCSVDAKNVHIGIGYQEEKFTVIPNGIDISLFSPDNKKRNEFRKKLGLSENDLVIGIAGRYDPQKDYATFIEAARQLSMKKLNIHYVLYGDQVDDENLELMQMIDEINLQDRMHLFGYQSNMQDIYLIMDVFVSTSAYGEAFPNVLAEAMACGVPCVATNIGDAAYIIGDTGKVVPPKNAMAIAEAVEELLSQSDDQYQSIKGTARNRIIENFSLPKIAQQYKDTYNDILNNVR
jgi:glycosyltransferase involved in cell wall biosynthesis